jgi:hypothetical protein
MARSYSSLLHSGTSVGAGHARENKSVADTTHSNINVRKCV